MGKDRLEEEKWASERANEMGEKEWEGTGRVKKPCLTRKSKQKSCI